MSESDLHLAAEPLGPSTLVIQVSGALDRTTAAEVRESLAVAVAGGFPWLVLDLSGITGCDSSGLAAVIDSLRAAHLAGGDLMIAASSPAVRRLLARTELDRILTPHATVAAAAAALS